MSTGVDKHATLREMATKQLTPGVVSYGAEGVYARGILALLDEIGTEKDLRLEATVQLEQHGNTRPEAQIRTKIAFLQERMNNPATSRGAITDLYTRIDTLKWVLREVEGL